MAKELHELNELEERVILVAVEMDERSSRSAMDTDACLDELEELVKTAGATAVARSVQKRERIHPGHYLGTGKIEELKAMLLAYDATGIVCDDELSPAQLRNLEQMLGTKVMDRTIVILDIFAARALSGEGKIQVELAQLKYRLSRLTGMGASMSRLGGGIGTRGPGEKKLETDRRYIKERIAELNKDAQEIRTHRELLRAQRSKKGTPVISLVGYTNAGKSTILNRLSDAGVLAEDKLFATLDPTSRKLVLPSGMAVLLVDTVGFVSRLPHNLVEAFKSTLEEAAWSDVIVRVADAGDDQREEQLAVTDEVLDGLDCADIPRLTVYNKCDKPNALNFDPDILLTSAKTGYGLDALLKKLDELLSDRVHTIRVLLPYDKLGLAAPMRERGSVQVEEYREDGLYLEGIVKTEDLHCFEGFLV